MRSSLAAWPDRHGEAGCTVGGFEGQPIPRSVINRVVAGLAWPAISRAIPTGPPELQLLSSVHGHPGRATSEALALLCGVGDYRLRN